MRADELHKLVVRVFDRGKGRFIPKFDNIITCGTRDELEPIKLLIELCDKRVGWTGRVDYRQGAIPKEYHILQWSEVLPDTREGREPHDKYAGKAPHDVRGWEPQ